MESVKIIFLYIVNIVTIMSLRTMMLGAFSGGMKGGDPTKWALQGNDALIDSIAGSYAMGMDTWNGADIFRLKKSALIGLTLAAIVGSIRALFILNDPKGDKLKRTGWGFLAYSLIFLFVAYIAVSTYVTYITQTTLVGASSLKATGVALGFCGIVSLSGLVIHPIAVPIFWFVLYGLVGYIYVIYKNARIEAQITSKLKSIKDEGTPIMKQVMEIDSKLKENKPISDVEMKQFNELKARDEYKAFENMYKMLEELQEYNMEPNFEVEEYMDNAGVWTKLWNAVRKHPLYRMRRVKGRKGRRAQPKARGRRF